MRTFAIIVRLSFGGPDTASGYVRARDEAAVREIVPAVPGLMLLDQHPKLWPGRPDRFTDWSYGVGRDLEAVIEARAATVNKARS